jgi:hypothetical protein
MLAERLPLAMGDSDLRVLVGAGDKPNSAALERPNRRESNHHLGVEAP